MGLRIQPEKRDHPAAFSFGVTFARHTRSFLGLNYSDDLIWLELTLITDRLAKDKRLGLLKALNDRIVDAAQISPDDLLITFFETAEENISFGRGFAQRADNSKSH